MDDAQVCAIVYGATADPVTREVVSAVEGQTRRPGTVITGRVGLRAAVEAAQPIDAAWIWLLDGGAVPAPQALEALLDAAGELPGPGLLSSQVLDPQGALDHASLPRHVIYATDVSVAAAERHLVELRAAGSGSVLVRRRNMPAGVPLRSPGGWAMLDWSARILRGPGATGYLVPRSVAIRRRPLHRDPSGDLVSGLRSLAGRAWTPREKLREAFLLSRRRAGSRASARREAHGR